MPAISISRSSKEKIDPISVVEQGPVPSSKVNKYRQAVSGRLSRVRTKIYQVPED